MSGELISKHGSDPPDKKVKENPPSWRILSSDGEFTIIEDTANDKRELVIEKPTTKKD